MAANRCKGNLIKQYREDKGITQEQLAKEMRKEFPWVDASLISKMENNLCNPTEEMIEWACKSQDDLIESRLSGIDREYPPEEKVSETADFSPLMRTLYTALKETDISHRLTRYEVMKITGLSDRRARDVIEDLRAAGIRVGSELGDKGYWLISSEDEYKRFSSQYSSRAYKVLKNKSAMDNYTEGQIRI